MVTTHLNQLYEVAYPEGQLVVSSYSRYNRVLRTHLPPPLLRLSPLALAQV